MTTDSPWHSRWRSESHYQGHYHFDRMQDPQPPAPITGNHTSPNLPSFVDSYSNPWDGKSRGESAIPSSGVTSMIDRYADASTYHSRLHGRHTSPGRNSSLITSPSLQNSNQPWHSLPVDHYSQNRHITDAPLTLHIPQTQRMYKISPSNQSESHGLHAYLALVPANYCDAMTDLPNISRTYPASSARAPENQGSHPQQATSLPSFASLSEHASRPDDPDEVEIAPMSARLPCSSCNKLSPLIREVALAVAELDDNVQQYCNKSTTRV